MTGLTRDEFYDALYYGADIDFSYKNSFYHINAGAEGDNIYGISVYQCGSHPDEQQSFYREIYNKSFKNRNEGIDEFLSSNLFHGKSFYDIEQDIEILYS